MLDLLPFNIISPAADKLQNIQPGKKVKMYKCKMPKSAIFSQFLHLVSNQTRLIFISFRRNQHPPTLLTCQHNFHGGQWHIVMDSFEWTREVRTSRGCYRMFLELLKYINYELLRQHSAGLPENANHMMIHNSQQSFPPGLSQTQTISSIIRRVMPGVIFK